MNQRPERKQVVDAYIDNPRRKAHEIAEEAGLIDAMGYDKAVDYVRRVKRQLKANGQLIVGAYDASDEERLRDIEILFDLRKGNMNRNAAYFLLLLNCYYQFRSEDDAVHMMAIDDTYAKNTQLKEPFPMSDAIHICDIALAQYMASIDETMNEVARKKGYLGAGFHYSDERFIEKLEITEDELIHMTSIRKDDHDTTL